jgi:hypothetical protein
MDWNAKRPKYPCYLLLPRLKFSSCLLALPGGLSPSREGASHERRRRRRPCTHLLLRLPHLPPSRPRLARTAGSCRRGGARRRRSGGGAGGPGGRRQDAAPWAGAAAGIHPALVSDGPPPPPMVRGRPPWQGHKGTKEREWGQVGVKPRLRGAMQMGAVIMGGRAGHGVRAVNRGKGASATGDGQPWRCSRLKMTLTFGPTCQWLKSGEGS